MTIRLFDVEKQDQFEREMETYDLRVKDRMENPGKMDTPWPQYPKPPDPMVDTRDKGLPLSTSFNSVGPGSYPGSPFPVVGRDLNMPAPLDFDGNSQSEVKGFKSTWQRNNLDDEMVSDDSSPFSTKKG